jgi:chitinase
MGSKIFNGYWLGYQPYGNTLGETPSYINRIILFVAAPKNDRGDVDVSYLCKACPKEQQIQWAQQLQKQGAEVLISFMDTTLTHWNNVDHQAFAQNVKDQIIDGPWGLNGVDIDLESGMPSNVWVQTFINLLTALRNALGPIGATNANGKYISRISVAAYRPTLEQPILEAVGSQLDWLSTMAYWNDAEDNEQLVDSYRKWVENVNMGIGVYYQDGQSTNLEQTELMAQFAGRTANCGMMEFGLNNDCPYYSKQPQWTWASAINTNMSG